MKHIIAYSGGKDSTALLCWAKDQGLEFDAVFCDTGWEHPITYAYIEEINQRLLGGRLVTVKSEEFGGGMRELVEIKKRVPSVRARFCTEHMKVLPMVSYLKNIDDEFVVYQGIRADESVRRALMKPREWSDRYDCYVARPLFYWNTEQCFALCRRHGVKPNPLYLAGARRVGCFPCVLITLGELRRMHERMPELWDRMAELEKCAGGRSFFAPNYIPERFQSGFDPKSGKSYPKLADVKSYVEGLSGDLYADQPGPSCMSVYNLCD